MFTDILFEERNFSIFRLPLLETAESFPPDAGFDIAPCGMEQIPALARIRSTVRADRETGIYTDRMLSGSMCFLLRSGDEIAGSGWANAASTPQEDRDRYRLTLGGDGAYLWDFFIAPDYRGRSLYQFFLRGVQQRLAAIGLRRCFIKLDANDERSIRQHENMGASLMETVHYRRRFGLTVYRIETPTGSVLLPASYRSRQPIERDFSTR